MLDMVLEKPWIVGILGGVATVAAAIWWLNSGRREAIVVSILALCLTLGLVGIGVWIETEQEALRSMVYQTANDLQNNRKTEILAAIYESPSDAVTEAKALLNERVYSFEVASIKKIHSIEFSGPASARRAIVKMNVFVEGTFGSHKIKVPQFVEVTLYRVNDRWLVYDFIRDQPFAGFQN